MWVWVKNRCESTRSPFFTISLPSARMPEPASKIRRLPPQRISMQAVLPP
jgi:hypothetical protein